MPGAYLLPLQGNSGSDLRLQDERLSAGLPVPDVHAFVDVTEEVLTVIRSQQQDDAAYERRKFRHKAHYSLNREDGIENDALNRPSPRVGEYPARAEKAGASAGRGPHQEKQIGGMTMQFNVEEEKPDLSVSQCRPAQDDGEAPCRAARYGRENGGTGPPDPCQAGHHYRLRLCGVPVPFHRRVNKA